MQGYGVDIALLIDIAEMDGIDAIAQVDLGTRRHRNRPLDELGPQALAVLQAVLSRSAMGLEHAATLVRPNLKPVEIGIDERPALIDLPGYRRRSA